MSYAGDFSFRSALTAWTLVAICGLATSIQGSHASERDEQGVEEARSSTARLSGAETARRIDWSSLSAIAPIPSEMPTSQSDDPVEAGFAPQWVDRVVVSNPNDNPPGLIGAAWNDDTVSLVQRIVSMNRSIDDTWAYEAEYTLRQIILTKIDVDPKKRTVSRVFCNAAGCLCYVEQRIVHNPETEGLHQAVTGAPGRKLGINKADVMSARVPGIERPDHRAWELMVIRRPHSN
jgi:hypothetical protein